MASHPVLHYEDKYTLARHWTTEVFIINTSFRRNQMALVACGYQPCVVDQDMKCYWAAAHGLQSRGGFTQTSWKMPAKKTCD